MLIPSEAGRPHLNSTMMLEGGRRHAALFPGVTEDEEGADEPSFVTNHFAAPAMETPPGSLLECGHVDAELLGGRYDLGVVAGMSADFVVSPTYA